MKKIELIEGIKEQHFSDIDENVLSLYIGRAYNQIIYDTYRKDISNLDIHSRVYKGVEVKHNEEEDTYYSTLPVSVIQLPNSGDGVMHISTIKGKLTEFYPKSYADETIHGSLDVGSLDGPVGYWLIDGSTVGYSAKIQTKIPTTVKMRLVPQFEALDFTDEVHIPSGKDEALIELMYKFAGRILPEKEINDNSNKTP